jgi:hypothetical protein
MEFVTILGRIERAREGVQGKQFVGAVIEYSDGTVWVIEANFGTAEETRYGHSRIYCGVFADNKHGVDRSSDGTANNRAGHCRPVH